MNRPSLSVTAVRYFASDRASPSVSTPAAASDWGSKRHAAGFWIRPSATPSALSQAAVTAASMAANLAYGIGLSISTRKLRAARSAVLGLTHGAPAMKPS